MTSKRVLKPFLRMALDARFTQSSWSVVKLTQFIDIDGAAAIALEAAMDATRVTARHNFIRRPIMHPPRFDLLKVILHRITDNPIVSQRTSDRRHAATAVGPARARLHHPAARPTRDLDARRGGSRSDQDRASGRRRDAPPSTH